MYIKFLQKGIHRFITVLHKPFPDSLDRVFIETRGMGSLSEAHAFKEMQNYFPDFRFIGMQSEEERAPSLRKFEIACFASQQLPLIFTVGMREHDVSESLFSMVAAGFIRTDKMMEIQGNLHAELYIKAALLVKIIINEMGTGLKTFRLFRPDPEFFVKQREVYIFRHNRHAAVDLHRIAEAQTDR